MNQMGVMEDMADDRPLRLEAGAYGLLPDYQPLTMENIPKAPRNYQTVALPVPRQLFEDAYARMGPIAVPSRPLPASTSSFPEEAAVLFDYCCQPGNLARLPGAIARARLMELVTWFALCGAVLGEGQSPRLEDRLRQKIESDPAFDWTLAHAANGERRRRGDDLGENRRQPLGRLSGDHFVEADHSLDIAGNQPG